MLFLGLVGLAICMNFADFWYGANNCNGDPDVVARANLQKILEYAGSSGGTLTYDAGTDCYESTSYPSLRFRLDCAGDSVVLRVAATCAFVGGGTPVPLGITNGECMSDASGVFSRKFMCNTDFDISDNYAHYQIYDTGVGTCTTSDYNSIFADVWVVLGKCVNVNGTGVILESSGTDLIYKEYTNDFQCASTMSFQVVFPQAGSCIPYSRRRGSSSTMNFLGFGGNDAASTTFGQSSSVGVIAVMTIIVIGLLVVLM